MSSIKPIRSGAVAIQNTLTKVVVVPPGTTLEDMLFLWFDLHTPDVRVNQITDIRLND